MIDTLMPLKNNGHWQLNVYIPILLVIDNGYYITMPQKCWGFINDGQKILVIDNKSYNAPQNAVYSQVTPPQILVIDNDAFNDP